MSSSFVATSFGDTAEKERAQAFVEAWRPVAQKHPIDGDSPSYLSLLTEEEVEMLAPFSRRIELKPNQPLYVQGDMSTFLGFVVSGVLSATTAAPQNPNASPEKNASAEPDEKEPDEEQLQWTLTEGDTFGEYALVIDGQIGDGKREATLRVTEHAVIETIAFHKFAVFLEQLAPLRCTKIRDLMVRMVTERLYPELSGSLPDNQANDLVLHPWRTRHNGAPAHPQGHETGRGSAVDASVAGTMMSEDVDRSQEAGPKSHEKKVVVIDDPPVTFLNTDSFLECIWMSKTSENVISNTARAIVENEMLLPDTAVFHDGELTAWYFGSCNVLKRKSKEKLTSWALIEKICKNMDGTSQNASQTVATLLCAKGGKQMGSENVQYRLLDKRKLEAVVAGAKANSLTGVIQKYVRSNVSKGENDHILQCLWSDHSFSADWITESMLECFSQVHKPSRILRTKKLRTQMQIKYHTYVSGNLSTFGDHLKPKKLFTKPRARQMRQAKMEAFLHPEGQNNLTGTTVPRQIREVVKVACQQISSIMATQVNQSRCAHETAAKSADLYNSGHNLTFTNIETMCCFFKIAKNGAPQLVHCSAAFGHPDTVVRIQDKTRAELLDPKEDTFLRFAKTNKGVSMQGPRASTMDFTETLRLLIDLDLLYKQVTVTEVSHCFQTACDVRNVEDGQLSYESYQEFMHLLAVLLGEAEPRAQLSGHDSEQSTASPGAIQRVTSHGIHGKHLSLVNSRTISGIAMNVPGRGSGDGDGDLSSARAAGLDNGGWASFEKQRNLQRTRLGRLFASTIVYHRRTEDVERRATEREEKHMKVTEERRQRVQAQLRAEAEAAAERVKRARIKADTTLQQQADAAKRRWDEIEERASSVVEERRREAEERALAAEKRRQERREQLQQMKLVEQHRLNELSKKSELLEEHRREVHAKRQQERENSRIRLTRIGREKEVVSELFQAYARTGALHRPWGLVDLEGDALPAVLEIAADKSRRGKEQQEDSKALLLPIVGKGKGHRSKSSLI